MNRRGFLGAIGTALAGATLDPERLLWRSGAKTISIPSPSIMGWSLTTDFMLLPGDIFTIAGMYLKNPIIGKPIQSLRQFVVTRAANVGPVDDYFPSIIPVGPYSNVHVEARGRTLKVSPFLIGETRGAYASKAEMLFGKGE